MLRRCIRVIAALGILVGTNLSLAQVPAWPTKPIRIIVAYPPGGTTDIAGRLLAERLSASLGQQVVVENRAGAGGMIGAQSVARADADGYALLLAASPEVSIAFGSCMTAASRSPSTAMTRAFSPAAPWARCCRR